MFRDAITKRVSKVGEAPTKLVVATRERKYYHQVFNEETEEWETMLAGTGWEIVKDVSVTSAGLAEWTSLSAEEKAELAKAL